MSPKPEVLNANNLGHKPLLLLLPPPPTPPPPILLLLGQLSLHPSGVGKSSTGLWLGLRLDVFTCAGYQV